MEINKIYNGDALEVLHIFPDESINCVMTSPPYWALRNYGIEQQIGLEPTFNDYITRLSDIFDEVKRVLRKDGTCWINIGDTYSGGGSGQKDTGKHNYPSEVMCGTGNKPSSNTELEDKNLCNIPARFSIEMQNRGWILRNVIIWHKPNAMPSPVKDRFTVDFEYLFFFVKNKKYYFETQYDPHKLDSIKRACRARTSDKLNAKQYAHSRPNENTGYDNMMERLANGELNHALSPEGRNKRTVWAIENRQTPYAVIEPEFRKDIINFRDLPEHDAIRTYLIEWKNKKGITIEQIEQRFGNQAGHHWFEKDGSYPSKDDWIKLKELLEFDDTFDEPMTAVFHKSGLKQDSPEGRIKRTTWTITTKPFSEAHFATFPSELCEIPIKAGCPNDGIVLDPFCGAGTSLLVAKRLKRNYVGIDINLEYCKMAEDSITSNREIFTMQVLKEVRSGKQKILNDDGGTNFTKSSADDFPLQESLIADKREPNALQIGKDT